MKSNTRFKYILYAEVFFQSLMANICFHKLKETYEGIVHVCSNIIRFN